MTVFDVSLLIFRSMDIMLAPGSVQLGACCYPVVEAMACGTPVVTTGYLLADNDNYGIVPVADSREIAVAALAVKPTAPDVLRRKLNTASNWASVFALRRVPENFIEFFQV